MNRRLFFVSTSLCFVLMNCGPSLPRAPMLPTQDPQFAHTTVPPPPGLDPEPPLPFVLLPGDTVGFRMVTTDAMEGSATVDGTGSLHIPFAGDVVVNGATLSEAEQRIDQSLRRLDR